MNGVGHTKSKNKIGVDSILERMKNEKWNDVSWLDEVLGEETSSLRFSGWACGCRQSGTRFNILGHVSAITYNLLICRWGFLGKLYIGITMWGPRKLPFEKDEIPYVQKQRCPPL